MRVRWWTRTELREAECSFSPVADGDGRHRAAVDCDYTHKQTEWKGTEVVFEMSRRRSKTDVRFTHVGLTPWYECFDVRRNAWCF